MTDPVQSKNVPSQGRWLHFRRLLRKGLIGFWSLIIGGILVNVVSTRLTSKKDFPPDTPVGWALHNPLLTISFGIILVLVAPAKC